MATTSRSALLRSLPVLLTLVLALLTAPVPTGEAPCSPSSISVSASAVAVDTASADGCVPSARTPEIPAAAPVPTGSTPGSERVLCARTLSGAFGSRAPPAVSA